MLQGNNVLSRRCRPTTKSYRAAVKTIVTTIQGTHGLNDAETAERLGCSAGTIANARNERADLAGVTLANIEYEFGPSALDPFLELGGSRAIPRIAGDDDARRATVELSEVLHLLIAAQDPDSDGGVAVTTAELRSMLPQLRAARQSLDVLTDRAEHGMVVQLGARA
jgi:hypothetical protein